jgi:glycosyltransferase involved in cell wall biosynthesis
LPGSSTERAPSVSVVCTVRNGAATLGEVIDSIRAQDVDDWEMVVVDDGSTDTTAALVAEAAASDPRIRLVATGGIGRVAALNLAFAQARAELVANIDADDPSHPRRLSLSRAAMQADPRIGCLCTDYLVVMDDAPCRWPEAPGTPPVVDITRKLSRINPVINSSVMLRRSLVQELGGFAPEVVGHEDYHLWIRLAAAGHRLARIEARLASKRLHAGQSFERRRRLAYVAGAARMQAFAARTLGPPHHLALVPAGFLWGLLPEGFRRRFSRLLR